MFASSAYKEFPLASSGDVALYDAGQKRVKGLEKEIEQFLTAQREQLALIYARQAAAFLSGGPGLDADIAAKLSAYLKKPEEDHPFLKDWQASKSAEAAMVFQETLLDVIEKNSELPHGWRGISLFCWNWDCAAHCDLLLKEGEYSPCRKSSLLAYRVDVGSRRGFILPCRKDLREIFSIGALITIDITRRRSPT